MSCSALSASKLACSSSVSSAGFAVEAAQTGGVAVGEIDGDRDPFPAFGRERLGLGLELLGHQTIEQRRILQPAAIVVLEQIAHDDAARRLVGVQSDELRAAVGRADGALRQHAADLIWLLVVGARDGVPDLLLTGMVGRDGERHQLLERHAILGIDVEQLRRHRGQAQPLLDDRRRHEEPGGDLLLAEAFVAQRLERAELIERMQRDALVILGQRILLGDAALAHDAGDGLRSSPCASA